MRSDGEKSMIFYIYMSILLRHSKFTSCNHFMNRYKLKEKDILKISVKGIQIGKRPLSLLFGPDLSLHTTVSPLLLNKKHFNITGSH